jgi:DUF4097 and DUF4098 domain-containing protein YvlB
VANGYAYRRRRSMAGPVILIGMGLLFLLANIGVLSRPRLWWWFANWWPLLLILIGVVRLVEYFAAQRSGTPTPRFGGGSVFLLIMLIFIGIGASQSRRVDWNAVGENVDVDFGWGMYGQKFDFNDQLEQDIGTAKALQIDAERGAVKIHPQEERKVKIVVHRTVGADSQDEANQLNSRTKPAITLDGNTLRIQSSTPEAHVHVGFYNGPRVVTDLEIWAPKDLPVTVSSSHGDVFVNDRNGDVTLSTTHGDIEVQSIKGRAVLTTHKGSVKANGVQGDVSISGRLDDVDLAQVSGSVTLDGDFFGETKLSKIGKGVRFSSSRTDMQFARLDGDLQLDSGDLRATSLVGPITVRTRAKDIHLENVSGDITVENSHGEVELHPSSPAGNVDVRNRQGAIHMVLPPNAGFSVDARTDHGEIESDFDLTKSDHGHETTLNGTIGKGGPRIQLTTDHGTIEIRKS